MKVLFLTKYYTKYLENLYRNNPDILELSFHEHRECIFNDHFGWPADLVQYMSNQGIRTEFIIANTEILQKHWAYENNFTNYSRRSWEKQIVLEQIKKFKPDILWIDSLFDYYGSFIQESLNYCHKAITWISCVTPQNINLTGISNLITSDPEILKNKHNLFDKVIVTKPGFSPTILTKLGKIEKKTDFVFAGQISKDHLKRAEILSFLLEHGVKIKIFGLVNINPRLQYVKGVLRETLKKRDVKALLNITRPDTKNEKYIRNIERILPYVSAPVFGMDFYHTLAEAKCSLHTHIDIANKYGSAMRMFETTGVGTCLITDHKIDSNITFEVNKEIITYKSKEHLLDILNNIKNGSVEIERIAKAGQIRTLKDHSIERMYEDIKEIFY